MFVRLNILFLLALWTNLQAELSPQQRTFFETKIRPVLIKHCYECHSADSKESKTKLKLDVPVADADLIIRTLRSANKKTPHHKPLPEQIIRDFEKWAKMGAPFPLGTKKPLDESLWAFQPINNSKVPTVKQTEWPRDPIDHFALARMERQSLKPATDAKAKVLIRRLYYDLTGLPPNIEQVDKFV